jgi:cytochrome P450
MPRFDRPAFRYADLLGKPDEVRTQLQFDWLRDDGDREAWLTHLNGKVEWIQSRCHFQDDPAPPRSQPVPQGRVDVALLSDPADVRHALSTPAEFSNAPYAELGGASFMLAIDPGPGFGGSDWHDVQRNMVTALFAGCTATGWLQTAAERASDHAELLSLRATNFDLAEWAEQAALRYFALLFGFSERDHILLEDAARAGYRALQYIIIGRHFTSEPGTLPAAQQAMARLGTRTAALIDEYALRERSRRLPLAPAQTRPNASWPDGVQPWSELGLSGLGEPMLKRLPALAGELSGQDLCNIVAGLLVGTVGNVQTALCQMVQHLLDRPTEFERVRVLTGTSLNNEVTRLLGLLPPVPFLPRRVVKREDAEDQDQDQDQETGVGVNGARLAPGTDCILALRPVAGGGCPHAWGEVITQKNGKTQDIGTHSCIGRGLIEPLLAVLLQRALNLPGLAQRLDGLTGEVLEPERLWGFGCLRYPLRHDRDKRRVQQPLIVLMRVKSPLADNAERLRRIIRSGAPRIEHALKTSRHVHMAWFEFMDNDSVLALRTVYDGDFDAYIEHFALKVGDLFDQLFECIEGAPPLPVAEYPDEFVETIRRSNRAPLGGYFFSAYPQRETAQINQGRP